MRASWLWLLMLAGPLSLAGCQKSVSNAPASATRPGAPGIASGTVERAPSAQSPMTSKPSPSEKTASHEIGPPSPGGTPSKQQASEAAGESGSSAETQQTFSATLTGSAEVPAVKTGASGQARFEIENGGKQLHFDLTVHDLKNVTMAHLHMAAAGKNGPVVAWLYPSEPREKLIAGVTNGTLAEGTLTGADLVGPLKGKPLSDLVAKITSGDVYVNVHTKQNPEGALRGDIINGAFQ